MRFDGARVYGFIAPEHGWENVFLHPNDLLIPEVLPAARTCGGIFDIDMGERGPKVSSVPLADRPRCLFRWHKKQRETTLSVTSCARTSSPWK